MMPLPPLILTPGVGGADGLSMLSRQVIDAVGPVEVWSLTDQPLDDASIPSLRAARGSRGRYAYWGVRESFRKGQQRIVISLHAHLLPVTLAMIARGARLVHFLVGIESWKSLSWPQAAALRRASRLVSISRHSEAEFRRANPAFSDREITICYPGLPALETSTHDQDRGYALIVGRMSKEERYKGHDLLLDVWGDVRRQHPGAELVIAGGGDDQHRLEEKARSLSLGDSVRFVGHVSELVLETLYRDCALFVMPSRHEGFGFVFLEAMRAAKPCVGARGAASEIIEEGVSGWLVDIDDPRSLATALVRLFRDSDMRKEMGARGKTRFLSEFTAKQFASRLHKIVEGVQAALDHRGE